MYSPERVPTETNETPEMSPALKRSITRLTTYVLQCNEIDEDVVEHARDILRHTDLRDMTPEKLVRIVMEQVPRENTTPVTNRSIPTSDKRALLVVESYHAGKRTERRQKSTINSGDTIVRIVRDDLEQASFSQG